MRMVRSSITHSSHRSPNHDRSFDFSIGHVRNICGLLDDLSNCFQGKIKKDFVDHGARACHSRANGYASGSQFADARVTQPVIPEFLPQSAGLTEVSTAGADALANVNDAVVPAHFFA